MSANVLVPFRKRILVGALVAAAALALMSRAESRVSRIVIDATVPISGQPYQQLTGRAFGELDPRDPHNALITDIVVAPQNAGGMVEYIASFRLRIPND